MQRAIDQHNYSPCMNVPNVQVAFEKERWGLEEDWIPKNSGDVYGGELNLKQALAKSVNTVSAYLMKRVGPRKVRKNGKSHGFGGPNSTSSFNLFRKRPTYLFSKW